MDTMPTETPLPTVFVRKRGRATVKLKAANTSLRRTFRVAVKAAEQALRTGDEPKATVLFSKMQEVVEAVADKGLFKRGMPAHDKRALSAKVRALGRVTSATTS